MAHGDDTSSWLAFSGRPRQDSLLGEGVGYGGLALTTANSLTLQQCVVYKVSLITTPEKRLLIDNLPPQMTDNPRRGRSSKRKGVKKIASEIYELMAYNAPLQIWRHVGGK